MAIVFKCSEDTIQRAVKKHYKEIFSVVFGEKRLRGFVSLRRRIWQSALNGNVTLLIFLAKQYLGMSDKVEVTLPGHPGFHDQRDLSRLTDEQLAQQRILSAIAEGLIDPAVGAKQLTTALAKLPKETPKPGPEGGSPGADGPSDRRVN